MKALQEAVQSAQARTGRSGLGTQVKQGLWQVVDVTFPAGKRGRSTVTPLSDWVPAAQVIAVLNSL